MSFNAVEYLSKLVQNSADDEQRNMNDKEAINLIDAQGFHYEYEERAAILEYDGGLNREDHYGTYFQTNI